MLRVRAAHCLAPLFPMLALTVSTSAQTAAGEPATPRSSTADWTNGLAIVATILVFFIGIGVAVKLYDVKRRRAEETGALQSLLSEALLVDRSVAGLPVAVFVSQSFRRSSPMVIAVRGSVPTPMLRDAVMRLVEQEAFRRHPGARTEDRLTVDPLVGQVHARSARS